MAQDGTGRVQDGLLALRMSVTAQAGGAERYGVPMAREACPHVAMPARPAPQSRHLAQWVWCLVPMQLRTLWLVPRDGAFGVGLEREERYGGRGR